MITVSLCMIVKNEEEKLAGCLESLKDIADEILIADTGSTDRTVAIAQEYGAKIFSYDWKDDFADARNFIFAKASCEYIYSADADEELDEKNREAFQVLKKCMDPQVEIVQMYYCNQLASQSVYNFDRELRPKLFKRERVFTWQDPIHEQVRLEPVVFDSDIEIQHHPVGVHAGRDIAAFNSAVERGYFFSERLVMLYARELFLAGTEKDFIDAKDFFIQITMEDGRSVDIIRQACCVIVHAARIMQEDAVLMKFSLKEISCEPSSEMCCELGAFYAEKGDYQEAELWYYNAAFETQSILDIRRSGNIALYGLAQCYEKMGNQELAEKYRQAAVEWKVPSETEN